jgi:hypothetical protein
LGVTELKERHIGQLDLFRRRAVSGSNRTLRRTEQATINGKRQKS